MAIRMFYGMKIYIPEVGDKVKVKDWDAMVKEYDVDANGSIIGVGLDPDGISVISYGPVFKEEMRGICGMEFEIKELLTHIGFGYVRAVSPDGTIGIRASSVVLEPIMDKKYEITRETTVGIAHTSICDSGIIALHRIKALKDFGDVKAGQLGGFVECEDNLSQDGECWIYDDSCVFAGSRVSENAKIMGGAKISGKSEISGDAVVMGMLPK